MPFCPNCGFKTSESDRFCAQCGRQINGSVSSINEEKLEKEPFIGVTAPLYDDLFEREQNILIAGMTGSGKSVILNGIVNSILYEDAGLHQILLVDVKRVEFSRYSNTAHCIALATEPIQVERVFDYLLREIEKRFKYMEEKRLKIYDGPTIHLFIDEMADLMLTSKNSADRLQRICQIGRAAKVFVVAATQCPLSSVIPTRIKVNFPVIIGLHTATAQQSRNIIDVSGCEDLPMFGEALIMYPTIGVVRKRVPMIPEEWLDKIIEINQRE